MDTRFVAIQEQPAWGMLQPIGECLDRDVVDEVSVYHRLLGLIRRRFVCRAAPFFPRSEVYIVDPQITLVLFRHSRVFIQSPRLEVT